MGKYDKILFCTDFSDLADVAFGYACDLAQQHKGELHIFHTTSEAAPIKERMGKTFDFKEKIAKAFEERYVGECPGVKTECAFRHGLDHEQIIKYAEEENVNVIVLGTHGKSGFFKDVLLGSCAQNVVRKSPVPVFIIPPPEKG